MLFIHETLSVYKLETFKNSKEVKHIVTIIIAIFTLFILCDIWAAVANYFQKILRIPLKKSSPPFLFTSPLKIQKSASPPFGPTLKIFQIPPCRKGGVNYGCVTLGDPPPPPSTACIAFPGANTERKRHQWWEKWWN